MQIHFKDTKNIKELVVEIHNTICIWLDDAIVHDKYWESPFDGRGQGLSWMSECIYIVLRQMQTQSQIQIQF